MIKPGTNSTLGGMRPTLKSSEESRWLSLILAALDNSSGIESAILEALGGSPSVAKTPTHYDIDNDTTETIDGTTVSAISFSVIEGEASITISGDTIVYPAGTNDSWESVQGFDSDFVFTVAAGDNRVIVKTLSI